MRVIDEANTEARRTAIIAAAIKCLVRSGVAKTSISDICREAGMRSGHLYYYFESKDALLTAIMGFNQEAIGERIRHMLEGEGDLAAKIFAVHEEAENQRNALGLTPILRMELECYFSRDDHAGPRSAAEKQLSAAILQAIKQGIKDGQLPEDIEIDAFGAAIALIWNGLAHNRLSADFNVEDNRRAVQTLLKPWLRPDRA